jgi:hypothetical protein
MTGCCLWCCAAAGVRRCSCQTSWKGLLPTVPWTLPLDRNCYWRVARAYLRALSSTRYAVWKG